MAQGLCSSSAAESDSSFELSSLGDNCSEISDMSEPSLSPRIEVEPYLFEPEQSLEELSIDREVEDLVEAGSSCVEQVGNCSIVTDTAREPANVVGL